MPLGEKKQKECAVRAAYLAYKLIREYVEVHAPTNKPQDKNTMMMRALGGASVAVIAAIWGREIAEKMADHVHGLIDKANALAAEENQSEGSFENEDRAV